MKKLFTLSVLLLLTASSIFAQLSKPTTINYSTNVKQKNVRVSKPNAIISTPTTTATSASSMAVIASYDFPGTLSGWTTSIGAGGSASGTVPNWFNSTVGPTGSFAIPAIASTTAANGFLLFDSDVNCNGDQNPIITSPVINCSTHPNVKLRFQQQYRKFNDSTFVEVSNNGTSWTTILVNGGFTNNDATPTNPETVGLNISAVAGGQATVYIRFRFASHDWPSVASEGCGYAWMIDDVVVEDLPLNDLATVLIADVQNYEIPLTHALPITFVGRVANIGANAQSNTVLNVECKNASGAIVATATSAPVNLLPSIDSSLACAPLYTPTAKSNYSSAFNATNAPLVDVFTPDNIDTNRFIVGDSTFQCVSQVELTGFLMDDINGSLNKCGFVFELTAADTITSLSTALWEPGFTNLGATATTGPQLNAEIYSIDATGNIVLVAATNVKNCTIADMSFTNAAPNTYIDIPLTFAPVPGTLLKGAVLDAGQYLVLFVTSGNIDTIAIVGGQSPLFSTSILQDETEAIFNVNGIYGRVNAGKPMFLSGIEDNALAASISIVPNPANNLVNINIANTNDATVTLVDAMGKLIDTKLNVNNATNFNVAALANGIYFINVSTNNAIATKRIVVAH